MNLQRYLVVLDSGQMYLFWAEDSYHAIEQAEDAEPMATVIAVYSTTLVWWKNNGS